MIGKGQAKQSRPQHKLKDIHVAIANSVISGGSDFNLHAPNAKSVLVQMHLYQGSFAM